jgi:hypothetical protein
MNHSVLEVEELIVTMDDAVVVTVNELLVPMLVTIVPIERVEPAYNDGEEL